MVSLGVNLAALIINNNTTKELSYVMGILSMLTENFVAKKFRNLSKTLESLWSRIKEIK